MKHKRFAKIWNEVRRWLVLIIGIGIEALAFSVFQEPYDLAAGGISGIGLIVNRFLPWVSVSAFYLIVNLPLLLWGFFHLGRWRFLAGTVLSVFLFSLLIGLFPRYLPIYMDHWPVTNNVLLSAVYAGLVGGIGSGLIYGSGATSGGTAIIGRVIQIRTGIPLSQAYLFVDGTIILVAAVVFGWEVALYAMLTLLLSGMAADYVLEGPSRARTATIATTQKERMIEALMKELGRGVSYWEGYGGYTDSPRTIILCTIYRPQVNDLKRIVSEVDPAAFVSIDSTQQVLGSGFTEITG